MASVKDEQAAVDKIVEDLELGIDQLDPAKNPEPVARAMRLVVLWRLTLRRLDLKLAMLDRDKTADAAQEARMAALREDARQKMRWKAVNALKAIIAEDEELADLLQELLDQALEVHREKNQTAGPKADH